MHASLHLVAIEMASMTCSKVSVGSVMLEDQCNGSVWSLSSLLCDE